MQARARSDTGAFTLTELLARQLWLMVVIVIIGLLATLVVPNVMKKLSRDNVARAKSDITAIADAIDGYAILNGGRYPESLEVLVTPDARGRRFLDRETLPTDPWGSPYVFEPAPAGSNRFRVISYGRDGQPGGAGDDADLDNVMIKNGEI